MRIKRVRGEDNREDGGVKLGRSKRNVERDQKRKRIEKKNMSGYRRA